MSSVKRSNMFWKYPRRKIGTAVNAVHLLQNKRRKEHLNAETMSLKNDAQYKAKSTKSLMRSRTLSKNERDDILALLPMGVEHG